MATDNGLPMATHKWVGLWKEFKKIKRITIWQYRLSQQEY